MIKKIQTKPKWNRLLIPLTCFLMLGACASNPPSPTLALQAAEQAIETAEQARVTAPELNEARENLNAARSAVLRKEMVIASRYADKSRVTAELATAKADTAKAKTVNDEMIKSTDTLKQEMQRNPGVQ